MTEPVVVPWRRSKRRLTEFGEIERWCRTCQEWWPEDREFWYYFGTPNQQCRACQDARTNRWRREHRGESRERRTIMGPAICQGCRGHVWLKENPDRRRRRAYVWEHAEGAVCGVAA